VRAYISTSTFRKYLTLLAASGLRLPDVVNLTIDGATRELAVLHKIELSDFPRTENSFIEPTMTITSWAVVPTDGFNIKNDDNRYECIDPERDWVQYGHFWAGKLERVYSDVNLLSDKKLAGFGWCGNSERALSFPMFYLVKEGPLFTTQVSISSLEMFTLPTTVSGDSKPGTRVGSIDESGVVTPVTDTATTAATAIDVSTLAPILAPATVQNEVEEKPPVPLILLKDGPDRENKETTFGGLFGKRFFNLPGRETTIPT
jgi:hypothetical protein